MRHLYNTEHNGIYWDPKKQKEITGPILLVSMPLNTNREKFDAGMISLQELQRREGIFGRELGQIEKMQKGRIKGA